MTLNLPRLANPRCFVIHPQTGRPVSFGWIRFYLAGTSTAKEVYADREGLVLSTLNASGGVSLDAAGSCEVYLSGPYRIEVYDANGALLYDADKINSITVETPAGNPGALIAANNLSDVDDPSLARAALGIEKQAAVTDETAGRLLVVGAFGMGGSVPAIDVASGALNDIQRVTGYVRVALADVTSVGAPTGAGTGICHTMAAAGGLAQVYYPMTGGNPSPWRRLYNAGAWSAWVRDYDYGSNARGNWYRYADGRQICTLDGNDFGATATLENGAIFLTSTNRTWTFPVPFLDTVGLHVSVGISNASSWGVIGNRFADHVTWRRACTLSTDGDVYCSLRAEGRWK